MVEFVTGNLFDADVAALVNTVNTKGVIGKGVALQFKRAFPANFKAYKSACDAGEVQLGRMFVTQTGRLENPRFIINFPTKGHWKSRSRLADVESGLQDLRRVLTDCTSCRKPACRFAWSSPRATTARTQTPRDKP